MSPASTLEMTKIASQTRMESTPTTPVGVTSFLWTIRRVEYPSGSDVHPVDARAMSKNIILQASSLKGPVALLGPLHCPGVEAGTIS